MSGYVPFAVERVQTPRGVVVRVAGEVDTSTAVQLLGALGPDEDRVVTVDLAETTFMDSSALNALVSAVRNGAVLAILHPTPSVRKLLELTGLESYLALGG